MLARVDTLQLAAQEAAGRPIPVLSEATPPGAAVRGGDYATASASPATAADLELESIALSALAHAARASLPALKLLRPLGSAPAGAPASNTDGGGAGGGGAGGGSAGGTVSPPIGRYGHALTEALAGHGGGFAGYSWQQPAVTIAFAPSVA